jgi:hypothetical protein
MDRGLNFAHWNREEFLPFSARKPEFLNILTIRKDQSEILIQKDIEIFLKNRS